MGDILRCLTGGYLKGTVHRVRLDEGGTENRYSMPFFIRARSGRPIQTLNAIVDREYFENYTDYFDSKFRTTQCTGDFAYIAPF